METIKLNITQLNSIIKRIIDSEEFLQSISVYGEVSNFKISAGNAYFDIKEDGASLACIKFGADNLDIHNGDMVLLTGRLNYYIKTGKLSFIASIIEPYGLGELYKQYLLLKEKLTAEGLFDEQYKKELPRFANKVGVVTSETGAVIRDIVHVARKKNPYTDIIVYPARVQGVGAENEIIAGIKYFENTDVDVVILARGGGSFEDLAPFNTESLVRTIFSAKKPIISAVGHETDFSLSDFASDMRAPTPSVAGELAFFDFNLAQENIEYQKTRIVELGMNMIETKANLVESLADDVKNNIQFLLSAKQNALDLLANNVVSSGELTTNMHRSNLDKLVLNIEKSNPMTILKNGYSIVEKEGNKITSAKQTKVGDKIKVFMHDGKFDATITNKEEL